MRSIIAILLFVAVAADGQTRCVVTDTPRECFNRWAPVLGTAPPPVQQSTLTLAEEAVKSIVASANSGTNDLTSPSRPALKDFFSILSNEFKAAAVGDDGTNLSFGYNMPVPMLGEQHRLRFETVLGKPRASEAAKTALGDTTALESKLTTLDDLALSVAFNAGTVRFGRDLAPHRALFASLFSAPIFATDTDAQNAFAQSLVAASIAGTSLDTAFDHITVDRVAQLALMTTFENEARKMIPAAAPAAADQFALLLSNQPQLWASTTYRKRNLLVGPKEWSGRLTWEIGTQNLNGFYRNEGRGCAPNCADALAAYLQRTTKAHQADRLALSVEYLFSEAAAVVEGATTYNYAEDRRLLYSITYGRVFGSPLTGRDSRIDLTYTYNDGKGSTKVTTGDAIRVYEHLPPEDATNTITPPYSRSTAVFSFTPRLTPSITTPISVIYSDRVEELPFGRGGVSPPVPQQTTESTERGITVSVGVVFKLGPTAPSAKSCCCN